MSNDDETVERVGRALAEADAKNGRDPHVHYSDYRDNWNRMARAALSALPERELLREALSALEPFAKSAQRDWDEDAENDTEIWSSQGPGWNVSRDCYTVGDLRRARAAADKIRAAMGGEKP